MRIVIFAGRKEENYCYIKKYLQNSDFIIACDGGLETVYKLNLEPKLVIGDFDSVDEHIFRQYKNTKKIEYKAEKDFSDFEATLIECEKYEYSEILVFGVTGGRMDHTLSNISLIMKYCDKNIKYVDDKNEIFVTDKDVLINKSKKYLSIIPIGECKISIDGVKYELCEKDITNLSTFTISNEIVDTQSKLTLHFGRVIVIQSED